MNLHEARHNFLSKPLALTGNSDQSEFSWMFALSIVYLALSTTSILILDIFGVNGEDSLSLFIRFSVSIGIVVLYCLWLIVIGLPLMARRIKDAGYSPLWLFAWICLTYLSTNLNGGDKIAPLMCISMILALGFLPSYRKTSKGAEAVKVKYTKT